MFRVECYREWMIWFKDTFLKLFNYLEKKTSLGYILSQKDNGRPFQVVLYLDNYVFKYGLEHIRVAQATRVSFSSNSQLYNEESFTVKFNEISYLIHRKRHGLLYFRPSLGDGLINFHIFRWYFIFYCIPQFNYVALTSTWGRDMIHAPDIAMCTRTKPGHSYKICQRVLMYCKIIELIMDMAILQNCPCYSVVYFQWRYCSVSETETTTSKSTTRSKYLHQEFSFFKCLYRKLHLKFKFQTGL